MLTDAKNILILWTFMIAGIDSFILVPEELPSILSIFYSNIPPIKKGTDSRVGVGFRLGPNADLQLMFELGPQSNTQPFGPNAETAATSGANTPSKKRQTGNGSKSAVQKPYNITNPSERWLNTWKINLNEEENQQLEAKPLHVGDPTRSQAAFVNHLRQLYQAPIQNSTNT